MGRGKIFPIHIDALDEGRGACNEDAHRTAGVRGDALCKRRWQRRAQTFELHPITGGKIRGGKSRNTVSTRAVTHPHSTARIYKTTLFPWERKKQSHQQQKREIEHRWPFAIGRRKDIGVTHGRRGVTRLVTEEGLSDLGASVSKL